MIRGEFSIGNERFSNHITRAGLKHLLSYNLMADQPNLPRTDQYSERIGQLNTMFALLRIDGQTDYRFSEDQIFDLTWNDVKQVPSNQAFIAAYPKTNFAWPDDTKLVVEALGIGYVEYGGDGSKDFIFSYTNITPYTINNDQYGSHYDAFTPTFSWELTAGYEAYPSMIVNIDGTDYKFKESRYRSGDGGLFGGSTDVSFAWEVMGFTGANASLFNELVISDPTALARAFKVEYFNPRSFAVDITGFSFKVGPQTWQYRLDPGNVISVAAGKTLSLTLQLEIEGGWMPPLTTSKLDSLYMDVRKSGAFADEIVAAIVTTRPGLPGSQTVRVTSDVYSPSSATYNYNSDELYRIVYEHVSGRTYAPIYILGSKTPTTYSFNAPTIGANDGWFVDTDDNVKFRITVPPSVTRFQVASDDGVWVTYPVTGGQVNELTLDKQFLNPRAFYIRWGDANSTGLINSYDVSDFWWANELFTNGAKPILVEPSFDSKKATTDQQLVMYYVGKPSKSNITDTPFAAVNNYTGPGTGSKYQVHSLSPTEIIPEYAAIINNLMNAPHYGIPYTSKFLDVSQMKLVDVPEFNGVVDGGSFTNPNSSFYANRVKWAKRVSDVYNYTHVAYPRGVSVRLKVNPVATPHEISGVLTSKTSKVQIYVVQTGEILKTLTLTQGTRWKTTLNMRLFNHLDYGIRYLNAANENLSLGVEYTFKGNALAPPDEVTNVNYDAGSKTLSFTTPARGVRATIKRFNSEIYSFETQPGTTYLVTSTALVPTGRYELWVYNSNNETWAEPYLIFGDQDDSAIRPPGTGPYKFPEWNMNDRMENGTCRYTPDPRRFDAGVPYKVRFWLGDEDATIIEHKKNALGMTMSVTWALGLARVKWTTGLTEESTTYTQIYGSSPKMTLEWPYNEVVAQPVYVYHDWLITGLEVADSASMVYWNTMNNTYTPVYGNVENGVRQKTDIETGYTRNTMLINWRVWTDAYSCPLWHLDPTIDGYKKDIPIYLFHRDIYGVDFTNDWIGFMANTVNALVNGKPATWEFTRDGDNKITFMRCTNADGDSFHWDCMNKAAGWKWDQYDPGLIGNPDYADLAVTLEFCFARNQYYTMPLASFTPTPGYSLPGPNYQYWKGNNGQEAIFAKIKPYGAQPGLADVQPNWYNWSHVDSTQYHTDARRYYNADDMFNQALVNCDIASQQTIQDALDSITVDTLAAINGFEAEITTEVITKDEVVCTTILDRGAPFDYPTNGYIPGNSTRDITGWTAVQYDTDDFTIHNKNHPFLFEVIRKNPEATGLVKLLIGRKFGGEPVLMFDQSINTLTAGRTIADQSFYFMVMEFFDTDHAYSAPEQLDPILRVEPSAYPVMSTYPFAYNWMSYWNSWVWEEDTMSFIDNIAVNISDWYRINDVPFDFVRNPAVERTFMGGYDGIPVAEVWLVRLVDSTNPARYVELSTNGTVSFVGFEPGNYKVDIVPVDNDSYGNALDMVNYAQDRTTGPEDMVAHGISYTFTKNWLVTAANSRIGTNGFYVVAGFNIPDPATADPGFDPDTLTNDMDAFYSRNEITMYVDIPFSVNPTRATDVTDLANLLKIKCNGLDPDAVNYTPNVAGIISEAIDGMDPIPTNVDESEIYWGDLTYTYTPLDLILHLHVSPGSSYGKLTNLAGDEINSVEGDTSYHFHVRTAVFSNGQKSPLVTNWDGNQFVFTTATTWFNSEMFAMETYNNGSDLYTVIDLLIGQKPFIMPDYELTDPPFTMNTTALIIDELSFDATHFVPNTFMYNKALFKATVNGYPAEIILAPETTELPTFTYWYGLSSETYFPVINNPWTAKPTGEFLPIVDMESDRTYGPLPTLASHYSANDDWAMPMDFDGLDPSKNKYIYTLNSSMLDGVDRNNGQADGTMPVATMQVHCPDLDLVLNWDRDQRRWYVYTGQNGIAYRLVFQYLDLYEMTTGSSGPSGRGPMAFGVSAGLAPSPFIFNMGNYWIDTSLNNLVSDSVALVPHADNTDLLEISVVNNIFPNADMGPDGRDLTYRYKGESLPHFPKMAEEIVKYPGFADRTFAWLPINLPITEEVNSSYVWRINGLPATADYSHMTGDTPIRSVYYEVTEVAEDNVYPTYGSGDWFTITNGEHTVRHDVATGTWMVISGPDHERVVIEMMTPFDLGIIPNGYTFGKYALAGWVDSWTYLGFWLSNSRNQPDLVLNPNPPDMSITYTDGYLPVLDASYFPVPNYELFDLNDYRLTVHGQVITGVPILGLNDVVESMVYDIEEYGYRLVIDLMSRETHLSPYGEFQPVPLLGLDRVTNLEPNANTTMVNRQIDFIIQWDYMQLVDVDDTRPYFLTPSSTGESYTKDSVGFAAYLVSRSGSKKQISVAAPIVLQDMENTFEITPIIDTYPTQPLKGWLETNYTGVSFADTLARIAKPGYPGRYIDSRLNFGEIGIDIWLSDAGGGGGE